MADIVFPPFGSRAAPPVAAPADVFTFEAGVALLHELQAQRLADRYLACGDPALLERQRGHLFAASAARQQAGAVAAIDPPPVCGSGVVIYGGAAEWRLLRSVMAAAFVGRQLFVCGSDNCRRAYNCVIVRDAGPGDCRALQLVARQLVRLTGKAAVCGDYRAALRLVATHEGLDGEGLPQAVAIEPFAKFIAFRRGRPYAPLASMARWERRRLARLLTN